jgi:predicted nucleotidyltransferase
MVKNKINIDILKSIEKYIDLVNKHYKVDYIILFGSYAKGTDNINSDIDIAIISKDFSNTFDDQIELMKLTIDIDLRIEPHAITTKEFKEVDTPFIDEIIKTGIELYAA